METVKIVIELSEEDYKLALSRAALLGGMLDKKLVDAVRSGRRIEENAISDDGTLTVNVVDGREVNRVLVCGDNHFGGLYYPN